jgi:heme oxygenase
LHDSVNRLAVQRFTLGLSDYRLYREGIKSFYYIYVAFERTWAKLLANPAAVQPHVYECLQAIAIPQLSRTNAIASDLIYLYGPDDFDVSAPPDKKVRRECAEYIEKRLQEKPHLVLAFAHQYYMALFAGGKMLLRQMLAPKDFFPLRRPAGTYAEAQAFSTNMFNFPVDQGQEDELRTRFKVAMEHVEVNLSEEEKTGMRPPTAPRFWRGYVADN